MKTHLMAVAAAAVLCVQAVAQDASAGTFYKEPSLFSTRPSETNPLQEVGRFGPVGIAIELHQPAFVMKVGAIEPNSPAAATGRLKQGQTIETINGQKLAEIDPRIQLGHILAQAEATDGVIKFAIKGEAEPVVVKIPVLGAYSKTWPMNCPKSDKIVRQLAEYLSQPKSEKGIAGIGMLFLLSTGEEKDLEVVREWARKADQPGYPWFIGFGGIPLAECYLRTGDEQILANIQKYVNEAAKTQYLGGWMGRGGVSPTYGSGHLNAGGTAVVTFLMLAKECGAQIPEDTFNSALEHFYRYAGRGNNPYGDGRTEVGFVDNGKNGNLAFAMAAAAALTPDGEQSVYAGARDVCAMQSFYTTTFMLHGHTGGGIGEVWRSAAMGLLAEKKPRQYREFMDNRQWHYDLSRRFDGSFGILGGAGYDKEQWGVAYGLCYTIPRKTLRISGAPRGKFSKPFQLPKQPWGTEADNLFLSLEAVPDKDGRKQDLSGETLAKDSSMPFIRRFTGKESSSDDEVRRYIHHQDHNIRLIAASKVLGINSDYLGKGTAGDKLRAALLAELLEENDPRVQRALFMALGGRGGEIPKDVFERAIAVIKDPLAAWSAKDPALQLLAKAPEDWLVPHVDTLLPYLEHKEWWLQNAALAALTPLISDERTYQKVLPAVGKLLQKNQRSALTMGLRSDMLAGIREAGPAVQKLATEVLKQTYTGYAGVKSAPDGQNVTATYSAHLDALAGSLADVPGGLDVLYEISRQRYPDADLPHQNEFLSANPQEFSPQLKKVIAPIIDDKLIPAFVGKNLKSLRDLAASAVQRDSTGGDTVDELVALHTRAGRDQHGWRMFADLRNAEWSYHSFDPIESEKVVWNQLVCRYRKVTEPTGMENWFAPDFDPAKAGWLKAKSPFGQYNRELPKNPIAKCSTRCVGPQCYGGTPMNTLWEKEVLLLRGTFTIPPLNEGCRYRLCVNDGNHVGMGGGHMIYINGKPFAETTSNNGNGAESRMRGAYVTQKFLDEFKKGPVVIAVKTFLRFNNTKYKPTAEIPQGKFSLHLEEQRLPPLGDDLVFKSATLVPMLSSDWQEKQDPDDQEMSQAVPMFRWDGQFKPNNAVLGEWQLVGEVSKMEEFDPAGKPKKVKAPLSKLTLKEGGKTDDAMWFWSGDMLMDLSRYQALKMTLKPMGGADHLFVESGGFGTRNPVGWKSKLWVFKR